MIGKREILLIVFQHCTVGLAAAVLFYLFKDHFLQQVILNKEKSLQVYFYDKENKTLIETLNIFPKGIDSNLLDAKQGLLVSDESYRSAIIAVPKVTEKQEA